MVKELVVTSGYWLVVVVISIAFGQRLLRLIKCRASYAQTMGLAYILGFASLMNIYVVLALFNVFQYYIVLAVLVCIGTWLHREIIAQIKLFWKTVPPYFLKVLRTSPVTFLLIGGLIGLVAVHYLAAFAPPVDRDVIAYHLPEAKAIVATHGFNFGSSIEKFYTNLPMLMEVSYAFGIILSGYSLAHLWHYTIFVFFLLFVFGWLKQYYSQTTAVWACLALFTLHQFVRIATTALVDSAFMCLEVMVVLLLFHWIKTRESFWLMVAGAILGVAMGIKYSPIFTAVLALIFITVTLVWRRQWHWRSLLWHWGSFIIPAIVFGGGWYIKNLLVFHNPIYPLLFGHVGFAEDHYAGIVAVIKDWQVPRTIWNYFKLPYVFYGRSWWESSYPVEFLVDAPQTLAVLLGLVVTPLIAFVKKERGMNFRLVGYMVLLSLYWFFVATHQVRFLDTANVVLVIVAVIALTQLSRLAKSIVFGISGSLILCVGLYFGALRSTANLLYNSFFLHIVPVPEIQYALGRTSKLEYLQQSVILDCGYSVLEYLQQHDPTASVLDNWTEWHNWQFKFYNDTVPFYQLPANVSAADAKTFILDHHIQYIYFNQQSKDDFPISATDYIRQYYAERVQQEQELLVVSKPVYTFDTCVLHQIDREKLTDRIQ